jgi:hypothetical protein
VYIATNKATLGCIVWHPLDGRLLIKDGQLGWCYRNDINSSILSNEIITTLKDWTATFPGRIIVVLPFVADLLLANVFDKTIKKLQLNRARTLMHHMKVAHRCISHIEDYLREHIKHTFLPPLAFEVTIINENFYTPSWVRDNILCRRSIASDDLPFPRLHQDYSSNGRQPGTSSMAGMIFTSILNNYFKPLPFPSLDVPILKLVHMYAYKQYNVPATYIYLSNYAPKTLQKYEQRKRRAIQLAPYKIQRLQDRITDLANVVKTGLTGTVPNLQSKRTVYFNNTTYTKQPTVDTDFYYNASLSDRLQSSKISAPQAEIDYQDIVTHGDKIKVAIFGHSFVNHVERDMKLIDDSKIDIQCFGISGGKLSGPTKRGTGLVDFDDNFRTIRWRQFRPHLTFLLFGGNDITYCKSVSALTAQYSKLNGGVTWPGSIIVMSVEPRYTVRDDIVSMEVYEEKRIELNNRLFNVFRDKFWDMDQFWSTITSRNLDGVHLNELHNKLLSNYIKGKITQIVGFECE